MNAEPLDLLLSRDLPSAAAGCQQAYGRIVRASQNTVTAIALAITRDVGASEDIAQEAFLRAWQQLSQLHNHASFLPWLRQITRNLARDWLRANRHRPLSGEAAELAIGMAADADPTPAERLQRAEEEIAAEELICALPEDSRETLLLYYREGQSSQQVAALLGLSDAAVRKRLSRARACVREQMLVRFGEFARHSAPGAAFAVTLASSLLIAAPTTASAAVVLGTGLGAAGGAGKVGSGLGISALGGGTALGSLWATVVARAGIVPTHAWLAFATAMLCGCVLTYASGFYLLSYADTELERRQLRGLIRRMIGVAVITCIAAMAVSLIGAGVWWMVGSLLAGTMVLNVQFCTTLYRLMAPMLARDAARHGRQGPTWIYQGTFGRPALIASNVFVLITAAWTLSKAGAL